MNEIINIDRLSQLLGIDALRKDVEKLQQQLSSVKPVPAVDVEKLHKQIAELQNQVKQLNSEKSHLNSEKSQLIDKTTQLNSEKSQLRNENSRLNSEINRLNDENKHLVAKNGELKTSFTDYDFLSLYNQLDDESKDLIDNYFPPDADNKEMIFTALQENNVKNFYQIVRDEVNKSKQSHNLNVLLRMVFEFYSHSAKITFIEPNVGDPLDNDEHTSKSYNQTSGSPITELLLFGYKDSTGKVLQKALVNT